MLLNVADSNVAIADNVDIFYIFDIYVYKVDIFYVSPITPLPPLCIPLRAKITW